MKIDRCNKERELNVNLIAQFIIRYIQNIRFSKLLLFYIDKCVRYRNQLTDQLLF